MLSVFEKVIKAASSLGHGLLITFQEPIVSRKDVAKLVAKRFATKLLPQMFSFLTPFFDHKNSIGKHCWKKGEKQAIFLWQILWQNVLPHQKTCVFFEKMGVAKRFATKFCHKNFSFFLLFLTAEIRLENIVQRFVLEEKGRKKGEHL